MLQTEQSIEIAMLHNWTLFDEGFLLFRIRIKCPLIRKWSVNKKHAICAQRMSVSFNVFRLRGRERKKKKDEKQDLWYL